MSGNMPQGDQAFKKFFSSIMAIKYDMYRPLMEHKVFSYINCSLIIALHRYREYVAYSQLMEEFAQPRQFCTHTPQGFVFYFCRRKRDTDVSLTSKKSSFLQKIPRNYSLIALCAGKWPNLHQNKPQASCHQSY